jgi:hypothetical protein
VTRTNNPGTHKLVKESSQAGAEAIKAKEWSDAERQAKRERAKELDLSRHLRPRFRGDEWTETEMKLLGKLPDAEVARRTGRTVEAARIKRTRMRLPTARDGRRQH